MNESLPIVSGAGHGAITSFMQKEASHYEKAREHSRILEVRKSYLNEIKKYRAEGREMFCEDETWIFKNMLKAKA